MDEYSIVRSLLLRIGRGVSASAPFAEAIVDWARPHAGWLLPQHTGALTWDALLAGLPAAQVPDEPRPHALRLAGELAKLLALTPFDGALLTLMIASDRLARVSSLLSIAVRFARDVPTLLGEVAGAEPNDAERAVRRSAILRLGLVSLVAHGHGAVEVETRWTLDRLLDRAPAGGVDVIEWLVGRRQAATLGLDDFGHVDDAAYLVRLLRGASAERAAGVNILLYGPPGTGKTEFARTLAAAAGLTLYGIGEADDDGDEPDRHERVASLILAQRVLGTGSATALLFDEMEDLIGDASPTAGDWFARRQGSKVFVNRLLETNPLPVIWTSNAIGNIDGAILRRMSFVLRFGMPSRGATLRMLDRIAADEGVTPGARYGALIDAAPETATVLRVASRAGRLAGDADGGARAAEALVQAMRGGELPPDGPGPLDLDLFETDRPLAPLFEAMRRGDVADVSLLLTGPPGTGKTALAHHLARALDRPLIVKRASDLLSRWVGQTEALIADAFEEARRRGGVLLFDEIDSLLFDRSGARGNWEVSQVNEMLTWLDRHPLPVVAATNYADRLDPAALRRFVFKLALQPLGGERAGRAFERFFGLPAPPGIAEVSGLTPGDFAVVARQLRHAPADSAREIVGRLQSEVRARPAAFGRIGF